LGLTLGVTVLAVGPSAGASTNGQTIWVARYDGPSDYPSFDTARSVAVSPDGSKVFVTGYSYGVGDDYATLAYDASTGTKLWLSHYNVPGYGATSLVVSPDGARVFVTGTVLTADRTQLAYGTVAYDASTGTKLWMKRFVARNTAQNWASSLAVSPDGSRVFVTGYGAKRNTRREDYATVTYDASTGATLWWALYNGPASGQDIPHSVTASPDGSKVFVTGKSEGGSQHWDYATVAYNASIGTQLWVSRYSGQGDYSEATSIATSPEGSKVVVTGVSSEPGSGEDYATVAYDASGGAELWVSRYDDTSNGDDGASSLVMASDGSKVFVTGHSRVAGKGFDYATIAYKASSGDQIWLRRYNGRGNGRDLGYAIATSPDGGKVFVTGESTGEGGNSDYATVAYDASTGAKLWVKRYNGPANDDDLALAIAASPDGSKVLVTGSASVRSYDTDYVTVAYAA